MTNRRRAASPAATDAWLHLDGQLCFALYAASLTMTRVYKPHLDALGLTYPQYIAMLALWEVDGLSVGELGRRLFLDSGTLTPLLKRLEAMGLLQRTRSQADARRVDITLTQEGRQLREKARNVPIAVGQATGCSLGELAELTRRLHGLRASLDNAVATPVDQAARAA